MISHKQKWQKQKRQKLEAENTKDNQNKKQSGGRFQKYLAYCEKHGDTWMFGYELTLLFLVLLISVTVAWFSLANHASAKRLAMRVGDTLDYISVTQSQESNTEIDGQQIELFPDEVSLEPGKSGSFSIFLKPQFSQVVGYELSLKSIKENGIEIAPHLLDLIRNHILFYTMYDETLGKDGYQGPIKIADSKNEGAIVSNGMLEANAKTKVDVYFIWPYERKDVPHTNIEELTKEQSALYDQEDNQIGASLSSLSFVFEIKARLKEGEYVK